MAEYAVCPYCHNPLSQGEYVKVVRCRDCRYARRLTGGEYSCHGYLATTWDYWNDEPQENPVKPDGFCAWGERNE